MSILNPSTWFRAKKPQNNKTWTKSQRSYEAASHGSSTYKWPTSDGSADLEVTVDMRMMRNRMRALVRDDPYALRAVTAITNGIVGSGLKPTLTGQNTKRNEKDEARFIKWAKSLQSDFYERTNFYGIQRVATMSMVESGMCIILKRYRGMGAKMQLAIQVLEIDYLVSWYRDTKEDGGYAINGIHYDANDRIVAYELYDKHPGGVYWNNGNAHSRVSADNAILYSCPERANQTFCPPWGHASIISLRILKDYLLAESNKQKFGAATTMVITTPHAEEFGKGEDLGQDGTGLPDGKYDRVAPGEILYLQPGETAMPMPAPQIGQMAPFVKGMLRQIAAGFGITYELLSGDMSDVNFSVYKAGAGPQNQNWEAIQKTIVIPKLLDKIAQWWLDLEIAKGNITPKKAEEIVWSWTPPAKLIIEPKKEAEAMLQQLQMGVVTFDEVVKGLGGDPSTILKDIAQHKKDLEELGLKLASDYSVIHEENTKIGSGGSNKKDSTHDDGAADLTPNQARGNANVD
jgi:lambda family phage portal protein